MSGNSEQVEIISLSDSDHTNDLDDEDLRNIDAEIIDYGVIEDDDDDETLVNNNTQASANTSSTLNNVITKPAVISVVDCQKYPWFYKKYKTQILKKINKENNHNMCFHEATDAIKREEKENSQKDSQDSIESLSKNIDSTINKIDSAYEKWKERKLKLKRLQNEDKEILVALQQRNFEEIDYKKNKGLIGVRIKPKIKKDENNSNASNSQIKKRKKSKKLQHNRIIKDIVRFIGNNTTITPVKVKKVETPQKFTKENIKSLTDGEERVKRSGSSYIESKCKIPTKNNINTQESSSSQTTASKIQRENYNSFKLTQERMANKRKEGVISLSKEITIRRSSTHAKLDEKHDQAKHDEKGNKNNEIININNSSHSAIQKSKNIQENVLDVNLQASKSNKAQTSIVEEKENKQQQQEEKADSSDSYNKDVSIMINSVENQKVTMTIKEKRQNTNNASLPTDVVKNGDALESTGNIITSAPNQELPSTNHDQTITVNINNTSPSPTQSNLVIYKHKMKPQVDTHKSQDISTKIKIKSQLILSTSTENQLPPSNPLNKCYNATNTNKKIDYAQQQDSRIETVSHNQNVLNNNLIDMNKTLPAEQNQNVLLHNDVELAKRAVLESHQINQADFIAAPASNYNNEIVENILKMKQIFNMRRTPEMPSANHSNNSIEIIISDRNTTARAEKPRQDTFIGPQIPQIVHSKAGFSGTPSKVVSKPTSTKYHRSNYVIAPMYLSPRTDLLQLRHQLGVQQGPPTQRYGLQMGDASYRIPYGPRQNLPVPQYNNMEIEPRCMQPIPSLNNQRMLNNTIMSKPPGISNVRPDITFSCSPHPTGPAVASHPDPNCDSVIGRNHEGIVKRINIPPPKHKTPQTTTDVSVNQANPKTPVLLQSTDATSSIKSQTKHFKTADNVGSITSDFKRPIVSGDFQENPRYCIPGPLSKKQKRNATQKNESAVTEAPHSTINKGYSSPVLPIAPSYDMNFQAFPHQPLIPVNTANTQFQNSFESQLCHINKLRKNILKECKNSAVMEGQSPKRNSPLGNKNCPV